MQVHNLWELQTLILLLVISPILHNQLVDSINSGTMCNARSSAESTVSRPAVPSPADDLLSVLLQSLEW